MKTVCVRARAAIFVANKQYDTCNTTQSKCVRLLLLPPTATATGSLMYLAVRRQHTLWEYKWQLNKFANNAAVLIATHVAGCSLFAAVSRVFFFCLLV